MLVLSRKEGESIKLAEVDVVLQVLGIKKSKVQIGIAAPDQITIQRGEQAPRQRCIDPVAGPTERILIEMRRLEIALIALADLAGPQRRSEADRIADKATATLRCIEHALTAPAGKHPQAIGGLVTVRPEAIEHLKINRPSDADSTPMVREAVGGYCVIPTDCHVA